MRTSIAVTNVSWPDGPSRIAPTLTDIAGIADGGGLDTLWVADHLLQGEPATEPTEPILEAYTTLGHLAARTRRIRLGTMVSAVTYRAPALLIKAVTTLDVLSEGRAWLGIGAGYHAPEAEMTGMFLPPTAERFAHLEDTLALATRMWAGDESPFVGTHHRATRPICSPAPTTRPHPPILVAGTGEKKTLRLVARYAQACNLPDIPDEGATIRRKLDVLAEHCTDVGRDRADIEVTVATRMLPGQPPAAFAEHCEELAQWGADHVVALTSGPWTPAAAEALATAARLTTTAAAPGS